MAELVSLAALTAAAPGDAGRGGNASDTPSTAFASELLQRIDTRSDRSKQLQTGQDWLSAPVNEQFPESASLPANFSALAPSVAEIVHRRLPAGLPPDLGKILSALPADFGERQATAGSDPTLAAWQAAPQLSTEGSNIAGRNMLASLVSERDTKEATAGSTVPVIMTLTEGAAAQAALSTQAPTPNTGAAQVEPANLPARSGADRLFKLQEARARSVPAAFAAPAVIPAGEAASMVPAAADSNSPAPAALTEDASDPAAVASLETRSNVRAALADHSSLPVRSGADRLFAPQDERSADYPVSTAQQDARPARIAPPSEPMPFGGSSTAPATTVGRNTSEQLASRPQPTGMASPARGDIAHGTGQILAQTAETGRAPEPDRSAHPGNIRIATEDKGLPAHAPAGSVPDTSDTKIGARPTSVAAWPEKAADGTAAGAPAAAHPGRKASADGSIRPAVAGADAERRSTSMPAAPLQASELQDPPPNANEGQQLGQALPLGNALAGAREDTSRQKPAGAANAPDSARNLNRRENALTPDGGSSDTVPAAFRQELNRRMDAPSVRHQAVDAGAKTLAAIKVAGKDGSTPTADSPDRDSKTTDDAAPAGIPPQLASLLASFAGKAAIAASPRTDSASQDSKPLRSSAPTGSADIDSRSRSQELSPQNDPAPTPASPDQVGKRSDDAPPADIPPQLASLLASLAGTSVASTQPGSASQDFKPARAGDPVPSSEDDTGGGRQSGPVERQTEKAILAGASITAGNAVKFADSLAQASRSIAQASGTEKSANHASEMPTGSQPDLSAAMAQAGLPTGSAPATSATPSQPPASAPVHTPAGQPGWADEVGNRISWFAGHGESKAELVLTPTHLGKVEVTITVSGDQTTAQFVAATPAARDALEQALPQLRETLADAGISLGQTSVGTSSGQSGAQGDSGRRTRNGQARAIENVAVRAPGLSRWTQSGDGLVDTFA